MELRFVALLHKPRGGPRTLPAPEAVRLATLGGAKALGLGSTIGSLELGKRGDVIAVDVTPLHTIPTASPWSQIAYAAQSCDVRHVAVDGTPVVRDRELLTLDQGKVRARATESASRLFG
jgi:5-methylthioadenosine/S-adenosylhomocysteine deaminase